MCGRTVFASRSEVVNTWPDVFIGARYDPDIIVGRPGHATQMIVPWQNNKVLTTAHNWGILGEDQFYNTRIETAMLKPLWSFAFANQRCVIPVTHFTERGVTYQRSDSRPMALAGIFEMERRGGRVLSYVSLLTKAAEPNSVVRHHRTPVFIDDLDEWLDGAFYTTEEPEQLTRQGVLATAC